MSPDSKEILHNSVYRREPLHVGGRREAPHPAGVDRTEPLAPLPNRLVGDRHASLREEIFSIAESEAESRVEPDRDNDTPRSMLRRMRRPTRVVGGEPASQILRQANVVLLRVLLGLQEIDNVATGHARATCKAPAEARWARRATIARRYGSPAEARSAYRRAKAGGGGGSRSAQKSIFPNTLGKPKRQIREKRSKAEVQVQNRYSDSASY